MRIHSKNLEDYDSFVSLGTGARRGCQLLYPYEMPVNSISRIQRKLNMNVGIIENVGYMSLEDVEHSLCEFYKYHKALTTGKMPKQKYNIP